MEAGNHLGEKRGFWLKDNLMLVWYKERLFIARARESLHSEVRGMRKATL